MGIHKAECSGAHGSVPVAQETPALALSLSEPYGWTMDMKWWHLVAA